MRSWNHEGAKRHPHVKVQQINLATHRVGFRALGKGTGVWPRGYNTHPHSYCFAIFSRFSEDTLQVLFILKAEATKVFFILFWRAKKKKENNLFTTVFIIFISAFHFFGRSLKQVCQKKVKVTILNSLESNCLGGKEELDFLRHSRMRWKIETSAFSGSKFSPGPAVFLHYCKDAGFNLSPFKAMSRSPDRLINHV